MTAKPQRQGRRPRGPFTRLLEVKSVSDGGLDTRVEATLAECAAVAAATDLPALASLAARFTVRRRAGGRVEVRGEVTADITQLCVVTLEPFPTAVAQPVDLLFAPAADELDLPVVRGAARDDHDRGSRETPAAVPGSDDQADPPDPIVDGAIDLGAVAVEFLTLARDPYPRKPDAEFADVVAQGADDAKPSPFAALQRLKDPS